MKINTFKEIIAWQKSHQLTLEIYNITKNFPKNEEYSLTSQIRRCAVSIPSNIAEGFKRKTQKESERFYNISEGSLEELKYQLILSKDLKYIEDQQFNSMYNQAEEVGKVLHSWKTSQH